MLEKDGGEPVLQAVVAGRNSGSAPGSREPELEPGAGARAGVSEGTGTDREAGAGDQRRTQSNEVDDAECGRSARKMYAHDGACVGMCIVLRAGGWNMSRDIDWALPALEGLQGDNQPVRGFKFKRRKPNGGYVPFRESSETALGKDDSDRAGICDGRGRDWVPGLAIRSRAGRDIHGNAGATQSCVEEGELGQGRGQ